MCYNRLQARRNENQVLRCMSEALRLVSVSEWLPNKTKSCLDAYKHVGAGGWTTRGSHSDSTRHFTMLYKCTPALGTTQPSLQWVQGFFPEGKAAWA